MRAIDARQKKIKEIQARIRLREGLPFLYGWKWYKWAREFYDSTNRVCLLTAANQSSKSSSLIRKTINWATNTELWPRLWITRPQQFWYMYPSSQQATSEFHTKWQQFLPRGEFKNHPKYGWKVDIQQKQVKAIYFNSGVRLYFKTYSQKEDVLQSSSVHAIFCDEEVPEKLYHELIFRLSATKGYFASVFTATMGQDYWRRAMEPEPGEKEVLPSAFKRTVSLYDCLTYEDGTKSHWTIEDIKRIEEACATPSEVLKRVHGKFIKDIEGRKYPTFDIKKHFKPADTRIPADWSVYAAVDLGSGLGNHPAAIVFIAVSPDLTCGRVFKCWRGDGIVTSAGDVFNKFMEMKAEIKRPIVSQYYDFGGKDFDIISTRAGEPFIKAEKSHELGEQVMNTLFKFGMMTIDESDDGRKLALELSTLSKDGPRKNQCNDLSDATRYCAVGIPWDFSKTVSIPEQLREDTNEIPQENPIKSRHRLAVSHEFEGDRDESDFDSQFEELNELLFA